MKFVAPELEVKLFSTEDILTTSSTSEEPIYSSPLFNDCEAELPLM